MINPSTLDLKSLPWLPLEEKAIFPSRPAIYFAIDSLGTVQYIGRTVNVRSRWGKHHKYSALSAITNVKVAYLFVDLPELLPDIEQALIEFFSPPLNKRRKAREKKIRLRKPKAKRNEIKVNYRLAPEVKSGVARTAEIARRSENLHAEYLLRLGLLVVKGVDATKLTDEEIFKEFSRLYEDKEATDFEENKR